MPLPLLALAALGATAGGGLAALRHGNATDILKGALLGGAGGAFAPSLAPMVGLGAAPAAAAAPMASGLGSGAALGSGAGQLGAAAIPALSSAVPAAATTTAATASPFAKLASNPMLSMGLMGLLAGGKQGAMMGAAGAGMSPELAPQMMLGALGGAALGGPEYSRAGMALAPQLSAMNTRRQSVFGPQ